MLRLPRALAAWNTPRFGEVLKLEMEAAGPAALPLQHCLTLTSYPLDDRCSVMFLGASGESADPPRIHFRVGVFFHGVVAGCNCADDPTPVEAQQEYCELDIAIDMATAAASITPAGD